MLDLPQSLLLIYIYRVITTNVQHTSTGTIGGKQEKVIPSNQGDLISLLINDSNNVELIAVMIVHACYLVIYLA